jgi:hypothetical protein
MKYLIEICVPVASEPLVEAIVQTAIAFLGAAGAVRRASLGSFVRANRSGSDALHLVVLHGEGGDGQLARERLLESVLRRTLQCAAENAGDVRVFSATDAEAAPSASAT